MQDRYTGDIGDFGKYRLLKSLVKETGLKLGVNWYLVPNEEGNADGMKIDYLLDAEENNENFKNCDSELYEQLQKIVKPVKEDGKTVSKGKRAISEIEKDKILPSGTIFYSEKLSFENMAGRETRIAQRKIWVENGLKKMQDCEIVFFDPDNGFEVASYKRHYNKGIKYVFYDEIVEYYRRSQILIIYQHHKQGEKDNDYKNKFKRIKDYLPFVDRIFGLRYLSRDFVFILQKNQYKLIVQAANCFLDGPRGKHFQKLPMEL